MIYMNTFLFRASVAALVLGLSGICDAAPDAARTPELAAESVLAQVLFGLGCVTAAIFALAWIAKRLGGARLMQQSCMDIVASTPLGTREKLVLVKVENTKILLGVTSNSITRLHVFDRSEVPEKNMDDTTLAEHHSAHAGEANKDSLDNNKWDFTHYLKQLTGVVSQKPKDGSVIGADTHNEQHQVDGKN